MAGWKEFIRKLFGPDSEEITPEAVDSGGGGEYTLRLKMLMMASAIGYLSAGLLMCDWRTIIRGKDVKQTEYYRLNNGPNCNQNKAEFLSKLVTDLAIQNEALIIDVGGQLFLADSWNLEERGTGENWYNGIHIDGDSGRNYNRPASQVMHLTMSWIGLWPMLSELAEEYESMISAAANGYATQTSERGVLNVSNLARGDPKETEYRERLLKRQFKEFFSTKSSVLILRDGYTYTPHSTAHRNTSEMNDVANLSDEYAERVGLALRVPPALLKGNAENTAQANIMLATYGIKPIAKQIEAEYGAKRLGMERLARGDRLHIDLLPLFMADPQTMASVCEKLTSCGQSSVDELRAVRGEPLLGTPEAQKHYITKNYGELGAQEGAEQAPAPETEEE